MHFADVWASLRIHGEHVDLEYAVLHDASYGVRTLTHELTIASDVLLTRRRIAAQPPDWAPSSRRYVQSPRGDSVMRRPRTSVLHKTPPPLADSVLMHPELRADLLALKALGAEQDHPAPVRQRPRRFVSSNLRLQEDSFFRAQNNLVRHPAHHRIILQNYFN